MKPNKKQIDAEFVLNDLLKRFNGQLLLNDAEICTVLRKTIPQLASMRSSGTYPMPITYVGRTPMTSIYHLANYLVASQTVLAPSDPEPTDGGDSKGEAASKGKRKARRSAKDKKAADSVFDDLPPINRPSLGPTLFDEDDEGKQS